MPIHGITGVPGHGKTSLMMELLAAALEDNARAVKTGKPVLEVHGQPMLQRPIWVSGIDGLSDFVLDQVHVLPDATRWNEAVEGDWCDCANGSHQVLLREGFKPDGTPEDSKRWAQEMALKRKHGHLVPDGALLFVDEAWGPFGHLTDARGRAVPLHVLALAEHRHRSIDMVWTFQGPSQMYPFARPLMAPHWHTVRRWGSQLIDIYQWNEFAEDVKSQGMRDRAVKVTRTLPRKQRTWWKSASGHTIKMKVPRKLIFAVVGVLFAIPLLWFGIQKIRPSEMAALGKEKAPETGLPVDGAHAQDGPNKGGKPEHVMTAAEWRQRLVPRIPGVHGSQPVFDSRAVVSVPRQFCVIYGEGLDTSCKCKTEQFTPVLDVTEAACREWAVNGRYDPFLPPLSEKPAGSGGPPGSSPPGGSTVLVEERPGLAPGSVPLPSFPPAKPGVLNPTLHPRPRESGRQVSAPTPAPALGFLAFPADGDQDL